MATAVIETWRTTSKRSGEREWGASACLACGWAPHRPVRADKARSDLDQHLATEHPGVSFTIDETDRR